MSSFSPKSHRPSQKGDPFLSYFALGTILLFNLIGGPFIWFATAKSLTCDRTNPQKVCQLKSYKSPLSRETTLLSFPAAQLQEAIIEESRDSDGSTYRVVVLTEKGSVPLTSGYSSGYDDKATIAEQINAFIKNSRQERLQVKQDDRWIFYLIGGIFVLVGNFVGLALLWVESEESSPSS